MPYLTPIMQRWGEGPQKPKILLDFFFKISEYKRSTLMHPSHDFYEIIWACWQFHDRQCVKIWGICSRDSEVIGVYS